MKLDLAGRKITVMGIGLHGGAVEMIKWLLKQGARVIATDMKSSEELAASLEKLKGLKNLTIVTGQHRMEDFERVDMVIKNPAVRWDNKYIKAALAKKVDVEMDSSLFFQLCLSKKIIGVTGTKGKTTTSNLIHEILKSAGQKVVKVGIGQEAVMNKLAEIDKETFVVFELSSWRLSALGRAQLSPHIAVITNLYQDHLNYYANLKEYMDDKKLIFENQKSNDYLVLNYDNEHAKNKLNSTLETKSNIVYFSLEKIEENKCVYLEDGKIKFNLDGQLETIAELAEIKLKGAHNLGNILAAVAVGMVLDVKKESMRRAVANYQGAPHRLELVREINQVKFYNDTAATTPESAIAAIDSFDERINLIGGGSNKNLDLTVLAEKIASTENVVKVFLLNGAATEGLQKLIEKFGGQDKIAGVYNSMQAAVAAAHAQAQEQEVVLLSPGCASFGMFQNEFDRGDKFKEAVKNLDKD